MHFPAIESLRRSLASMLAVICGLTGATAAAQTTTVAAPFPQEAPAAIFSPQRLNTYGQETPPPTSHAFRLAQWDQLLERLRDASDAVKVAQVNTFFNRHYRFQSDLETWGQEDYWATPEEFMAKGAGDCEDFAIAKYATLRRLGIPSTQLRLLYVRLQTGTLGSSAHMVLGYTPLNEETPLVLDNVITSVRPLNQRRDLSLVFGFTAESLWTTGSNTSVLNPVEHMSQWRQTLERMHREGWDDLAAPPVGTPASVAQN